MLDCGCAGISEKQACPVGACQCRVRDAICGCVWVCLRTRNEKAGDSLCPASRDACHFAVCVGERAMCACVCMCVRVLTCMECYAVHVHPGVMTWAWRAQGGGRDSGTRCKQGIFAAVG